MLVALLFACVGPKVQDSDSAADSAGNAPAGPFADVALTWTPAAGSASSWSFKIVDGEPDHDDWVETDLSGEEPLFAIRHNDIEREEADRSTPDVPIVFSVKADGPSDNLGLFTDVELTWCQAPCAGEEDVVGAVQCAEMWDAPPDWTWTWDEATDPVQGSFSGSAECQDEVLGEERNGTLDVDIQFTARHRD